jgi:protease-4
MALDPDLIVDRRRLRRKLAFWRVAGILALIAVVLAIGWATTTRTGPVAGIGGHVARVSISGFITYNRPLLRLLDQLAENNQVRAVVLQIDSPGGSTAGSEALYAAIRRVAARKPVTGVVGALGASGAYIAALATDHVVAAETSLVGSIGVVIQWAEVQRLLESIGVQFQQVKSSPLKAAPSPFEPATPEARAALQAVVGDSYQWFTDLVRTRRNIEGDALRNVADGRVFTGRQSRELRLVDALGDERAAIAWLERERHLPARLPIQDYRPQQSSVPTLFSQAVQAVGSAIGVPENWLAALSPADARLDGLVSLWHPALPIGR